VEKGEGSKSFVQSPGLEFPHRGTSSLMKRTSKCSWNAGMWGERGKKKGEKDRKWKTRRLGEWNDKLRVARTSEDRGRKWRRSNRSQPRWKDYAQKGGDNRTYVRSTSTVSRSVVVGRTYGKGRKGRGAAKSREGQEKRRALSNGLEQREIHRRNTRPKKKEGERR